MPHIARTTAVQELFEQDMLELSTCGAAQLDCPLQFQLVRSASDLKKGELEACLALVEHTSGNDYRASSIGWKPRKKKEEMKDEEMIYLLVRQGAVGMQKNEEENKTRETPKHHGKILGFMSFMFTYDDPPHEDREVIYMYEIHLEDRIRGRGLGSKLMTFLEMAARQSGISKTMLTVFASNESARALYEKLGYGKDACSPEDRVVRKRVIEADYVIMSKELV